MFAWVVVASPCFLRLCDFLIHNKLTMNGVNFTLLHFWTPWRTCLGRRRLHRNRALPHFRTTSSCSPVQPHSRVYQSCTPKAAWSKIHRCGGDWVWVGFARSQRWSCPRHLQTVVYSGVQEPLAYPTSSVWRQPSACFARVAGVCLFLVFVLFHHQLLTLFSWADFNS